MVARRFDVWLVKLDPTVGSEIRKTRPCLVVSPDSLNRQLDTVIVVALTSRGFPAPFRVPCRFQGKNGQIVLDQPRAVDRARLVRKLGRLAPATCELVLQVLGEMFAP